MQAFFSILHLVLSYCLLWVVPTQYLYLADLVAFPLALFLLSKDIASQWSLSKARTVNVPLSSAREPHSQSVTSSREISSNEDTSARRRKNVDSQDERSSATPLLAPNNNSQGVKTPFGKVILLIVNIVLFAMVLDFVYRPVLSPGEDLVIFRPGYVAHSSAKLHIRYPNVGGSISDKLELRYRMVNSDEDIDIANAPWESESVSHLPTNKTDFTMVFDLRNLRPSVKYLVELHSHQSTLDTDTIRLGSVEFKTAPAPSTPTKLRFATGSCVKPHFPYTLTSTPDVFGFSNMFEQHGDQLDLFLFLGDFIYADLPLYFGSTPDDYRRLYRQVYKTSGSRKLMRKVPMLHVYDDHEIKNNWHQQDTPPMGSALTAYNEYNGNANPPPSLPDREFYNFTHGDIAFYSWDTRRYRTFWEPKDPLASMLGQEQKAHFIQWLRDVNHTAAVKFVVSSVPLTVQWTNADSGQDTWRGYPTERAEILELTKYVPNLFFLSGDRHEMAAVELGSGNIEFSTSPVSQFTFPLYSQFKDNVDGDKTLHYRRRGHVKYGILDVDTQTDRKTPRVTYSLYTTDVHQAKRPAWVYEAKCIPWQ